MKLKNVINTEYIAGMVRRRWRGAGEHCIMRNFITCTLLILLGWSS